MKAIVYTSNTGSTKHYAELLGAETGLAVYSLPEAAGKLSSGAEVIYLGWLMAGSLKGYEKAAGRYSVKAVCAVGMVRPSEKVVAETVEKNRIKNAEVFYLQGGFDKEKLHGIYRLMMKTVANPIIKKLEAKADKTEEDAELLDMLKNGCDKVSAQNLSGVIAWYRGQA